MTLILDHPQSPSTHLPRPHICQGFNRDCDDVKADQIYVNHDDDDDKYDDDDVKSDQIDGQELAADRA